MSYDGRMLLIKSVLSSLTTFFMCSHTLLVVVIDQINKYLRHFLWRKFGKEDKGPTHIAWDKVYKPKDQGGMGILDVTTHNKALLIKNLHNVFLIRLIFLGSIWSGKAITRLLHHRTDLNAHTGGKHISSFCFYLKRMLRVTMARVIPSCDGMTCGMIKLLLKIFLNCMLLPLWKGIAQFISSDDWVFSQTSIESIIWVIHWTSSTSPSKS